MKAIKTLLLFLSLLAITNCDKEDDRIFDDSNGRFVRFFLQTDANGNPLQAPDVSLASTAVATYDKANIKTLRIPVALTSQPLSEDVTVTYTAEVIGLNNIELEPANQFTFSGSQLVDTLYVKINELYDPSVSPSITLKLTGVNDASINLGMPNEQSPNDQLTINFQEVDLNYAISSPSRVDVTGAAGEEFTVTVDFPNGYLSSNIQNQEFFTETQSNFSYTLTREPLISDDQVEFTFTINQDFMDDDLLYKTSFAINAIDGYRQSGTPSITFIRDPKTPRDKTLNTASQFYNTSDPFYRTFGVHWFNDNADNICKWRDFNAFTNPVVVSAEDPNAVLADDRGTSDPSDDLYYHAFRISFNANNAGFTTNPFDLKRWFTNESTNTDNSPGFNMTPALEFFPEDGISSLQGTVQVIEQTLRIGTSANNGGITEFLNISGAGTYKEIAPGLMEITIDVSVTNNRLFGGTRTDTYRIYNSSNFTDPAPLSIDCAVPIAL